MLAKVSASSLAVDLRKRFPPPHVMVTSTVSTPIVCHHLETMTFVKNFNPRSCLPSSRDHVQWEQLQSTPSVCHYLETMSCMKNFNQHPLSAIILRSGPE
ncbi:hypothetical protein RRG08_016123 [Elysia crispata]|uniref:Uncharacterized protein n=1 Tax=Elysia crispata TaxID=231223 RepID=A0AAE1DJF3_9GAST|nr:hypothetical protein RRG08_016123 [Elysia crispata]